jgi:predicted nucleic acid-binding protein
MKVVSNTSPLIALAKIEQLHILEQLFQRILISQTISDELLANCTSSERDQFRSACQTFIDMIEVRRVYPFARRLDKGEQEVLTLAIQEKAELVLLDDRKAYNEAQEYHLVVASTRAVLRIAEECQIIPNYRDLEIALRKKNFFLPNY